MNAEIIKTKVSRPIITLKRNKIPELESIKEKLDSTALQNQDDVPVTTTPALDFNTIYNELHSKFPDIINLNKPVLLAVGIRKEMSKVTGISGIILRRWIGKYFYKSKYYKLHQEGAMRFNLKGEEAGTVTEKHCEKMAKSLEQKKKVKEELKEGNPKNDLNDIRRSE